MKIKNIKIAILFLTFIIIFFTGIYYSLFEQLKEVNKTKGLHVNIPEIGHTKILNKDLEIEKTLL